LVSVELPRLAPFTRTPRGYIHARTLPSDGISMRPNMKSEQSHTRARSMRSIMYTVSSFMRAGQLHYLRALMACSQKQRSNSTR
jgi:hypothetical protein